MKRFLISAIVAMFITTAAFSASISVSSGGGSSLPDQTGNAGKVLGTDGSTSLWQAAGVGDMLGANNLSDVLSAATSRTNLGLGSGNNVTFASGIFTNAVTANSFVGSGTGLTDLFTTTNANLLYIPLGAALITANANLLYLPIGTVSGITTTNADLRYVSNNQTTNVVLNGSLEITQGTLTANEIVATGGITLGGVRNTAWPAGGSGLTAVTQSVQFIIPGIAATPATVNMLRDFALLPGGFKWSFGDYTLLNLQASYGYGESGAVSPNLLMSVNGSNVATLNLTGLSNTYVTTTTFSSALLKTGDIIEFGTDALGSNDDLRNLGIQFNARSR